MSESENRVIQCIDNVLHQLGEDVRSTFLLFLRRERGIKHYEIFQNPEKFINSLHSVLGNATNNIESEIIKNIEKELDLTHNENQNLQDLLIKIKKNIVPKIKNEKVESIDDIKDMTYMQYGKKENK